MSKYIKDPSLKGKHSRFNEQLFNKYDVPAREIVKNALGDFVADNPDIYKQDLIITDPNCRYKYIELQVCTSWVNDTFPHKNPYIFERKCHYEEDTLFMTLNKHMTKAYLFDGSSFKDCKPTRIKKYSREFIYNIPWHKVMPILISRLTPACIKLY